MRGGMRIEQRERERDKDKERIIVPSKRSGMLAFSLLIFCSLILLVKPSYSSTPNFDPDTLLSGDAHHAVLDGVSLVRLTRPSPSSSGLLRLREPLAFAAPTSLSTEFSFSVSPAAGHGLLLVLSPAPGNASDYVAVEFDTSKDDNVVGIDVGSHVSVAVSNVSDVNLVLNNGEKLNAWIDYEADSKMLQVRLSKWGEQLQKPSDPIVSHNIDFFKIWGGNPVFAGISSSNGPDSAQVVSVYSWRLSLRKVTISKGLHSLPADPHGNKFEDEHRKLCPLTVLAGVIFGTVCVALVTFVVLFMWVIFFHGREEESLVKIPEHPSDVKYERIDVAVDKNAQDDES